MKQSVYLLLILFCLISCNSKKENSSRESRIEQKIISKIFSEPKKIEENGEYIDRYPNGVIKMRGFKVRGKRSGVWKSWYENGSPWSETAFSEGMKNGKTTTWYKNEQKRYEGYYKNDVETGKWTFWDEKGKIINQKSYDK